MDNDHDFSFERQFSEPRPTDEPLVLEGAEKESRPVIALMGEFSAGKSTLSNLLIGRPALPVNITATQLPPVWMSYGNRTPYRVGVDGSEEEIDLNDLSSVSVNDTNHIQLYLESDILKECDLIDMPGISDPNMSSEVWERVIPNADGVIWCTHATQAWRQSEAAVWQMMPKELYARSFLLLTRMDKILSDRDRQRLVRRVEKETEGLFRQVCPISLLEAIQAGDNPVAWANSGAEDFMEALHHVIEGVAPKPSDELRQKRENSRPVSAAQMFGEAADLPQEPAKVVMPTRVRPRPLATGLPMRNRQGLRG